MRYVALLAESVGATCHFERIMRFVLPEGRAITWLLLCLLLGGAALPGQAEVPQDEFRVFLTSIQRQRRAQPEKALADVQAYMREKQLNDRQVSTLVVFAADVQNKIQGKPELALKTLDDALAVPREFASRLRILDVKLNILGEQGRIKEQEAVILDNWQAVKETGQFQGWLQMYLNLLDQAGRKNEALTFLQRAVEERIVSLDGNLHLPGQVARRHKEMGNAEQAFAWARLCFMLVPYSEGALRQASLLALEMTPGGPLPATQISRFEEGKARSPLSAAILPALDEASLKTQMSISGTASQRVTALLCLGDLRGAMVEARRQMLLRPQSNEPVLQVCRVLKAYDLSLKMPNDYLTFRDTGTGADPLQEFMKATAPTP